MLFYCARKVARTAATPISRLRIASLVPLIGEENFRSEKKRNNFYETRRFCYSNSFSCFYFLSNSALEIITTYSMNNNS